MNNRDVYTESRAAFHALPAFSTGINRKERKGMRRIRNRTETEEREAFAWTAGLGIEK